MSSRHAPGSVEPETDPAVDRADLVRILFVAVIAIVTSFRWWRPVAAVDLVAIVGTAVGAYPIVREAMSALLARRMTMELSMTIAFAAALAIGEYFTALVIVLFVLVAEVLEHLTVGRGRRAIKGLLQYLPRISFVETQGVVREVATETVKPGDVLLVKPGARIAVDGEVYRGSSFVDQATITGESLPIEKVPGSQVYAGTINQSGALAVRVDRVGHETAFGRIIQAVEHAEESRAPVQGTADRLAGYLVYFAMASASLTFILTRDARSTISVIIVAGACGIAAGTPLAILGAIGQAARRGVIVKGGLHLETLWTIVTVVLDKTGTLTFGAARVTAILPADGRSEREVLEAAAIAERASEHPLAKAILSRAAEMGVEGRAPESFSYLPGQGIIARHGGEEILVGSRAFLDERGAAAGAGPANHSASEVLVARAGRLLGTLLLEDVLRPEAVQAIRGLQKMGIRTVLLTGDSEAIGRAIADALGVDEAGTQLLPEQKLARIRELKTAGNVAMLGDGVNDTPALVEADVGVAMGSGTDVAREAADVILIGNDLSRFVETVRIARRCRKIIIANVWGTVIVDAIGVGLSAFGLLNPLAAAAIHVSSELAFILNSARLLPPRQKADEVAA